MYVNYLVFINSSAINRRTTAFLFFLFFKTPIKANLLKTWAQKNDRENKIYNVLDDSTFLNLQPQTSCLVTNTLAGDI